MAAYAGVHRRIDSTFAGYDKNKHARKSDWATDIEGACAEAAFAKATGQYWSAHVRSFKAPDVGAVHVRSTTLTNGSLIIRPNDHDDYAYALVICATPIFRLVGYIMGFAAKRNFAVRPGSSGEADAWFIPQSALNDPTHLILQGGETA